MKAIYDAINAKANKGWNKPFDPSTYEAWQQHWLKCAEEVRDEFTAQGLARTAQSVQDIIDYQHHIVTASNSKTIRKRIASRPILSIKI